MIKTSNFSRLYQLDLFQVITDILATLDAADTTALGFAPLHNLLREKFNVFDDAILQDRKTGLTDQLNQLDNDRDALFLSFAYLVRANLNMPFAEKAEAAALLNNLLDKYRSAQSLPLREETAALTNLAQELQQPTFAAALVTIGAKDTADSLAAKNVEFEQLYQQRTQKESLYRVEAAKTARRDVEDAYRRLVRAVNGLIEINGIDPYQTLCDHINRIADKALSAKR